MTKNELITHVQATVPGLTNATAALAVNEVIAGISQAVQKGEKVTLVGFGTFEVVTRAARNGRNPRTGAETKIPAKRALKFKVGKVLKESL